MLIASPLTMDATTDKHLANTTNTNDNNYQFYLISFNSQTIFLNHVTQPFWQTPMLEFPMPEPPLCVSAKPRLCDHITGRCSFERLNLELQIHANDSVEKQTIHKQFLTPPKLNVALILEGDLDATLDGQPLNMTARHGPTGYLWLNRQPARLNRWLRGGQRIRKVIVSLPIAQLPSLIGSCKAGLMPWLMESEQVFTFMQWQPNAQAIRHAEDILAMDMTTCLPNKLHSGIAALGLLHDALIQNHATDTTTTCLTARDVKRARQIHQYVLEHLHQTLSVHELAKQLGMSVSTLQRLFKNAYNMTVMEFVRTRRLELARLSLLEKGTTISEAAFQAGYSSTSNFSTAFQREFGYAPSVCVRGSVEMRIL